jgi:hypothetical protein
VERKVEQLQGSEFSEEQLRWAVLVTLHNGWPLRDAIVLREARRRAEMETAEAAEAWAEARELIRRSVPASVFSIWIEPVQLVGEDNGLLVLAAPSGLIQWLLRRYHHLFDEAVRATEQFAGARFAAVTLPISMREAHTQAASAA